MKLEYEVFEDKAFPGEWRVEAIDYENEGQAYITEFYGAKAEQRAREYVDLMQPKREE